VKLLWAVNGFGTGGGYGYSIHIKKLREAVAAAGATVVLDPREDFDLAVHIIRPDRFCPIPGKKNLLFTQVEMTEPIVWGDTVKEATALLTSCQHNVEVLSRYYSGPIHLAQEGVDPELFPFYQRKAPAPGELFRFLFNGCDITGRKGAGFVLHAWNAWHRSGRMPKNCQLYLKTTAVPGAPLQCYMAADGNFAGPFPLSSPDLLPRLPLPGIVTDTRDIPVRELTALYNNASAFILPSCGEGWGLTLTEAMATGAPCIWTHYSAPVDYGDDGTGYPIRDFKMIPYWRFGEPAGVGEPAYWGAAAEESAIIARMEEVVGNYSEALRRGRAASERMHSQYTWRQAAERFIEICSAYL
jgi:glycosyltransferase involved in cell wall biosynthesis